MDNDCVLLQRDENADLVDEERASRIEGRLREIMDYTAFIKSSGEIDTTRVAAVKRSCMIPTVRNTLLQHNLRSAVAQATYSAGGTMTLGDAVACYCWQHTDRERVLIFQMMRSFYLEYGIPEDVCVLIFRILFYNA